MLSCLWDDAYKRTLATNRKVAYVVAAGFLSSEWSFPICQTPYKRKLNVLNASLNKTFPSFLIIIIIVSESHKVWSQLLQTLGALGLCQSLSASIRQQLVELARQVEIYLMFYTFLTPCKLYQD